MSGGTRYRVFAPVAPGLEELLDREVADLGVTGGRIRGGGLSFQATREQLWTVALSSRLAESVRVRLGRFEARDFEALKAGLGRVPWHAYLHRGARVDVRVTCRKSRLYHSDAVAERAVKVISDTLGPPQSEAVDGRVFLRIERDVVMVSLDAIGAPLHRRGLRVHSLPISMRETMAAACLAHADLGPQQAMWDPFCGAGTLLLEALACSGGGLPGGARRFAFEGWRTHDEDAFASHRASLPGDGTPQRRVFGSDRDPGAMDATRRNLEDAGWSRHATLAGGDFEAVEEAIPSGCAVVTNLPYGHRTKGGPELRDTFGRWGDLLRRRADLAPVLVVNRHPRFERTTGLRWTTVTTFQNRGLRVSLLRLTR